MNIARGSINRPILTTIIFLIIITTGIVSFMRLSIDLMPEITYPTISLSTSYGNVGPEEMEQLVTRPIEEALAAVEGVEEITSTSTEGSSNVRISFAWGTDLDVASNDVRDRVDRILGRLPDDVSRPVIYKFDLSSMPIIEFGVSSDLNPLDLREILDDQVKYRLERVPGVAAVSIQGGRVREIHVDLNATKLKALGLSPNAVINALRRENQNIPAGDYKHGNYDILIRTQGEFQDIDEIRSTVVTLRDGIPIQIRDVADVEDSFQEIRQVFRINGKTGMRVSVNKQSGSNSVRVADAVKEEVARINRDMPQLQLVTMVDSSTYIKQSISNVGSSALIGGFLAILILFLFLRNVRSTLIISTAIPISVIATFGLIYFAGLTLNTITFGGLALGIGMLVDCAIVVLENIYRHMEEGSPAVKSSLDGTNEVWGAIVASTLTTIVVFIPVVFMKGMSGIMFQQMAYVVTFSLLCSLVVSLTLIPMLTSRFLKYQSSEHYSGESRMHRIYSASAQTLKKIDERYGILLIWALGNRRKVVLTTFGMFLVSVVLVGFIGVDLMPQTDEGEVRVTVEMAVGTRIEVMDATMRAAEAIVRNEVPEMANIMSNSGGGGMRSSGGNSGELRIPLVPKKDRKRSSQQIADDLRRPLSSIPGVTIRTRAGQGMMSMRMGSQTSDAISVEVRGYDLQTADELAQRVNQVVRQVPGVTDTRISRQAGNPEQIIRIDRQKAADQGLSVSTIGEALRTAVGGTTASYFRVSGKEYDILVRLSEEDRRDLSELVDLTVVNDRNQPVILRNVVNTEPNEGPSRLERKDQERIITINANYTGRDMGSIIRDMREKLRDVPVPKEFQVLFGGDYEEQQKAYRELFFALLLAIMLVYMVMAGQFESFRDPFIVLFSIPMAVIGVVVTMLIMGNPFTMQAFIGCIMLAGIVVNNAILLVDCTNQLRRDHNMPLIEAVTTAGSRRLRPILMTTLTTVLGLVPLAFGVGEGGETQAPMARVVIGGLMSSTLITLILVPVVYSLFEQKLKSTKPMVES
jgi:hydrophobic/amphiphilic exporter-1 (mainly G- bacteria), HAE1 family